MVRQVAFAVVLMMAANSPNAAAQSGQVVKVTKGDIVILEGTDTVRTIQRRPADLLAIYNAQEKWVLLLIDWAPAQGAPGDGTVDMSHTVFNVSSWTLHPRWVDKVVVDTYSQLGGPSGSGLGIHTSSGLIQFLSGPDLKFRDPAAVAVIEYGGRRSGGGGRESFATAEQRLTAEASDQSRRRLTDGRPIAPAGNLEGGVIVTPGSASLRLLSGPQPIRVGGNIREPKKVHHVEPVLPEVARQAGIRGVVIVEATIGVDGTITDTKILRSIPMLDQAALAAIRQWRYEPTHLNGQPVPVVMTVTANFE